MSNAHRKRTCKAAAALLLAGCLVAGPASSQEVIKWVDEDGVTHFGHAATAARQAVRDHIRDRADGPETAPAAGGASLEHDEPAAKPAALIAIEPDGHTHGDSE